MKYTNHIFAGHHEVRASISRSELVKLVDMLCKVTGAPNVFEMDDDFARALFHAASEGHIREKDLLDIALDQAEVCLPDEIGELAHRPSPYLRETYEDATSSRNKLRRAEAYRRLAEVAGDCFLGGPFGYHLGRHAPAHLSDMMIDYLSRIYNS